jgi:hypothetical protein
MSLFQLMAEAIDLDNAGVNYLLLPGVNENTSALITGVRMAGSVKGITGAAPTTAVQIEAVISRNANYIDYADNSVLAVGMALPEILSSDAAWSNIYWSGRMSPVFFKQGFLVDAADRLALEVFVGGSAPPFFMLEMDYDLVRVDLLKRVQQGFK